MGKGSRVATPPSDAPRLLPVRLASPPTPLELLLPGSQPGKYLIEEYAIALAPAPQLLVGKEKPLESPPALLVLGAVDFGAAPEGLPAERRGPAALLGGAGTPFAALPGTALESAAIAAAFRQSHPAGAVTELREAGATESALRERSRQQRYLHLATHGFFAPPSVVSALSRPAQDVDETIRRRVPDGGKIAGRSHPALWAAFVLSGDWR